MDGDDSALLAVIRAIVADDTAAITKLVSASPALVGAHLEQGATRQNAEAYFLDEIGHYIYAGDTALHVAAAAHRTTLARELVDRGADVSAKNRRQAEPLHYAVDGGPNSPRWNPGAQAATIAYLIEAGADPNAVDMGGVTPLHRAVRNRCAAAVKALLDGGADVRRKNKSGSTPMALAEQNTGKGGSGSPAAKAQQQQIVELLEQRGARR
jgi:ankyrin repeat protein